MSAVTFARSAISDYRTTAAILPSSQHLARAMVSPLRGRRPRVVVEFGPGTGVMTSEILRVMPRDGLLLAFEVNPRFVSYLRRSVRDPRLHVVAAGAQTATAELSTRGLGEVHAVVSSLGIGLMSSLTAESIFCPLLPYLGRQGTLTQYQYLHRTRLHSGRVEYFSAPAFMKQFFLSVETSFVWRNVPPAHVIACRGVRSGMPAGAP